MNFNFEVRTLLKYGTVIKRLRDERGLKAKFVAGKIGITMDGYFKLENNINGLSLRRLEQIAPIFGMTVPELLDELKKAS